MAKRKKREARRSKEADNAKTVGETTAATPLPPAKPPKRNPTLLAISCLLFAGWFVFLVYVACGGIS